MARKIRHDATGPYRLDPQDKPVFICMCGLSHNLPYCDGAHAACKAEEPGVVCVYDAKRQEVVERRDEA